MNITLLTISLIPIILFAYLDMKTDYRKAIKGAMISAGILGILLTLMIGRADVYLLGELGLLVLFGGISLKLNSEKFFRYQPTLMNLIFIGIVLFHQLTGEPIIIHMIKLAAEGNLMTQKFDLADPIVISWLGDFSWAILASFFLQMILMTYAAWKWSNWTWAVCRGLGNYVFGIFCIIAFTWFHPIPLSMLEKLQSGG